MKHRGAPRGLSILVSAALAVGLSATRVSAVEVLTNGNLDAAPIGNGWVQDDGGTGYPPIVASFELPSGMSPHTAPNVAWLGGLPGATTGITQTIAVPAGADRLKLTGRVWIDSEEPGGVYDVMAARLLTTAGVLLETLRQWSNLNENSTWSAFDLQATGNYAGQTIRLQFTSTSDASYNTNFFLDTISLDATSSVDVASPLAPALRLSAAGPNPTRDVARWRLDLPARASVRAIVRDLSGRVVNEVVDGVQNAGAHDLVWSGTDVAGRPVAPGVYFCVVTVGGRTLSRRIGVIR